MNDHSIVEDTFAEAFPMTATRLIITAASLPWAQTAARALCGHASSVIGCDCEAGIEGQVPAQDTPDNRPGISVLMFAFSRDKLERAVVSRVGQNVLTCPTTACFAGLPAESKKERVKLGAQLRFFGDGFQISKLIGTRRYWRIPVMDGEFLCEETTGSVTSVGGGNLLLCAASQEAGLNAAQRAVEAIEALPDCILPFPGGIVRSGSKVGSKYKGLPASTNSPWCPTLRGQTNSALRPGEECVYEIVIDGLSEVAVARAMQAGLDAAIQVPGLLRISAGNYGGNLGKHHFHLHRLKEFQQSKA